MLGGTLSTSPAQFTASMFVNKTKTTLCAHTVDKTTSLVCRSKRRFRPKPHAPVLFLSIYRDTVPLMLVQRDSKNHKQQTEALAMESCCICREGMKSKNWKVVRDVDVFKILVQLASSVVQ